MPRKKGGDNHQKALDKLNDLAPELSGLQGLKAIADGDIVQPEEHGLRVEYLNLLLVYPDPVQPRRILPDRIYQQFWDSRLTQTQALKELISLAQIASRQNGRPFNSVTDLLATGEEEDDNLPDLTHEEQLVKDLVTLAATIRDDGQVNPLTVVDVSRGATIQYRIETGERRYWATWLLKDFFPGYNHDGKIPCIVVSHDTASAFRQADCTRPKSSRRLRAWKMCLPAVALRFPCGAQTRKYPSCHPNTVARRFATNSTRSR